MKTLLSLLIVIISFLGILDAGFLTYEKINRIVPPCSPGFQCDTVLTSTWAMVGPIPLSALGLVFYSLVCVVATLNFLEKKILRIGGVSFHMHDLLLALTTFGAFFSLYLIFIMGVIIQAWCLYCLLSASFCASLFVLSLIWWKWNATEREQYALSLKRGVMHVAYKHMFKRIAFLLDPEFVHNEMVNRGKLLGRFPVLRKMTAWLFSYQSPRLVKTVDGIRFPNPVGLAAGFDYDGNLPSILPSVGFGFHSIGTVTLEAYEGNEKPRLGRFPRSQALLVNKGFKTMGAKALIKKLSSTSFMIPTGISIGSTNKAFATASAQIKDIVDCFKLFEKSKVTHSYYELNISCPNTKGGQPFTTPERLKKLLEALKPIASKRPVYIKMPIDLSEKETKALLSTAKPYAYIKGVIFGNLTKDKTNPDVNPEDKELWKERKGNLSGKPTWHRSNAHIAMTKKAFGGRFTIIGTGGIFTPDDAKTKIELGADLVQLITGMIFEGPQLIGDINRHLSRFSS